MNIEIVLQQMIIIFILIVLGAFLYHKTMLSDASSKQISGIIINLCNPALLLCSAFDSGPKVTGGELLTGALIVIIAYSVLILSSFLIPYLLHTKKEEHYIYHLLTIYGNVGFIGIPLASAVLGSGSLIYVSLSNLVYNILIYTHGITTIRTAAGKNAKVSDKKETEGIFSRFLLLTKKFINIGTVSAVLTIILYLCDFQIPVVFSDTLSYVGRSTTFLSMLVLGVSVAQITPPYVFAHGRLYLFALLRQILIPVACIFLFRLITDNALIISTTALMLAVPAGNMPLILSKEYELDTTVISRGIILSTLLSLITIPIVTLFV